MKVRASYGARLSILPPEEADHTQSSGKAAPEPILCLEGSPLYEVEAPQNKVYDLLGGRRVARDLKDMRWIRTNSGIENRAHRVHEVPTRLRNVWKPPETWEGFIRSKPPEPVTPGWSIDLGSEIYDDIGEYLWIGCQEIQVILDWLRSLPGSEGKHFYLRYLDADGLGIDLSEHTT